MKKVLVLSTHANLNGNNTRGDMNPSIVNKLLLDQLDKSENIYIHDLISEYPNETIDIEREQTLLSNHESIMMAGPMYWYSMPAIAKKWIDEVLLYGWAYGSEGNALQNKDFYLVITAASNREEFSSNDLGYTLEQLLSPYILTAEYCKMNFHPILFFGGINNAFKNKDSKYIEDQISSFSSEIIIKLGIPPI